MRKLRDMIFKKFYILTVIQVVLILLNCIAISLTIGQPYYMITRYSLILILIIQTLILIFFTNDLNRKLVQFLESFHFENYRVVFNKKQDGKNAERIYRIFDALIEQYENVKIQKEKEYQFFSNAIQHIGIGLLAYDISGKIILVNNAFLELFGLKSITNINKLDAIDKKLPILLSKISPGKTELFSMIVNGKALEISLKASIIKDENEIISLVSFQDIKSEIELKEIQSWQKLIRIINHEIINSLSPVNILSSSIIANFEEIKNESGILSNENSKDIINGLQAIHQRSTGLTQFVESYRNATHLAKPDFKILELSHIFIGIHQLIKEELNSKNIELSIEQQQKEEYIFADEKMIEQLIINLIKNSMQSCETEKSPHIIIRSKSEKGLTFIYIKDNGEKIPEEVIPNIFVPFFTTKEKGSGIGLSLSKQIIKLHNGKLELLENTKTSKTFSIILHSKSFS